MDWMKTLMTSMTMCFLCHLYVLIVLMSSICFYRNIFLGEVFSSYVSVHNDSNQPVKDIVIKVCSFCLY